MDIGLNDRVALITGAGSGIGRASALALAAEGCTVALFGRGAGKLEEVADLVRAAGGRALCLPGDVSVPVDVERAVADVTSRFQRLDVVFANAGIDGVVAPIDEIEPDEWDETLGVNLRGTFLTLKYAVPPMRRRKAGSIIVTASTNGTRVFSNAGMSAYSASKAGQVALAKMAALELAKDHIRVNVICPGAMTTGIEQSMRKRNVAAIEEPAHFTRLRNPVPLTDGEPGKPDDAAKLVVFLASTAASHITGTEVWIDGAESLLGESLSSYADR